MPDHPDVAHGITLEVQKVIQREIPAPLAFGITEAEINDAVLGVIEKALKDLAFLSEKDPSAYKEMSYVLESYVSFRSILYYRLARALIDLQYTTTLFMGSEEAHPGPLLVAARRISEIAKVSTGVEIHPSAQIGTPFAIDHGSNTVIGETSVIGRECYFLQAVTLGGRSIAGAPPGKRHPTIGDRVQIAGNCHVIGPIVVGDDVVVDPGAKITYDIPDGSHVRVVSTMQVLREKAAPVVFGVVPFNKDALCIFGKGLSGCDATIEFGERVTLRAQVAYEVDGMSEKLLCSFNGGVPREASGAVLTLVRSGRIVSEFHFVAALREIANG